MRIYRGETVEFTDPDGDTLVLKAFVRQADVLAVQAVEQEEALAAMRAMREAGVDVAQLVAGAQASDAKSEDSPKVREAKLRALAVKLVVGGEAIGGAAIIDAYRSMCASSAAWVDARVAEIWESCQLSDEGARAQAPVARPFHDAAGADGQRASAEP